MQIQFQTLGQEFMQKFGDSLTDGLSVTVTTYDRLDDDDCAADIIQDVCNFLGSFENVHYIECNNGDDGEHSQVLFAVEPNKER